MNNDVFHFITDKTLNENLNKCLDHVIDLAAIVDSDFFLSNPFFNKSSLFKTIILNAASIIEAVLHSIALEKNLFYETEWKYENLHVIHTFDDEQEIISAKRKKTKKPITKKTDFAIINKACFENKIIDESLFQKVETVRTLRNKIHLVSLEEVEIYDSKTIDDVFEIVWLVNNIAKKLFKKKK